MINKNRSQYPIQMMCRMLQVSESGYYSWCHRKPSIRTQRHEMLKSEIKLIFDDEKQRVGVRRITARLRQEGNTVCRKTVAKIMNALGLRAKGRRKYKATTNSRHSLPISPNLLEQNFSAQKPNEKWVSDITYIATDEGWLYLAVVMDLYSRKIVGWSLSDRMTATLVIDALQMAWWGRNRPVGVIVHSDRGSQYCSKEYQRLLADKGLISSMSKKGDCYDNAAMESWNHSFKVETIHGERFKTRKEAISHIFDYIHVYYNRKRLHSTLGFLSPESFEMKKVA